MDIFLFSTRINGNFVQGRRDDSPPGAATDGRAIWGIGRGCWPTEVGARAGGCVVRGERTRAGYARTLPWRARQPEGALVLADGGVSCQAHVG